MEIESISSAHSEMSEAFNFMDQIEKAHSKGPRGCNGLGEDSSARVGTVTRYHSPPSTQPVGLAAGANAAET